MPVAFIVVAYWSQIQGATGVLKIPSPFQSIITQMLRGPPRRFCAASRPLTGRIRHLS